MKVKVEFYVDIEIGGKKSSLSELLQYFSSGGEEEIKIKLFNPNRSKLFQIWIPKKVSGLSGINVLIGKGGFEILSEE